MKEKHLPIGIFDSGVGGLTVFSAVARRLPHESLIYLGDTARLPYGTKSSSTITRYALQATAKLVERNIKALVVACNTATAAALPVLRSAYPDIPVLGVVEPGAAAAVKASRSGRIVVLATESTVQNGAYSRAINALRPDAVVTGVPCSLFVALVEEGWAEAGVRDSLSGQSIAEIVARRYLARVFPQATEGTVQEDVREENNEEGGGEVRKTLPPDCIVLGCTHFPPLAPAIARVVGSEVAIVDSAATTAVALEKTLRDLKLLRADGVPRSLNFLTTDAPERFARVGSFFLPDPIVKDRVELVTL